MADGAVVAMWALRAVFVLALAVGLTALLQLPRLKLEPTLRGSVRTGTLYVVVTNRGPGAARGVEVVIKRRDANGGEAVIARQNVGDLPARDAVRVEVDRLHEGAPADDREWKAILVEARPRNGFPAKASLALLPPPPLELKHPPAVVYARGEVPCPGEPATGAHRWETRTIRNDGVEETWHVCLLCRHVKRDPISEDEKAIQARVRAERAAEQKRNLEEEFEREAAAARRHSTPSGRASWRRQQGSADEFARDTDTFPPEVAFFILELDASRATWEDALAAHRRLALIHHPDRRPGLDGAARAALERKMQEINTARDRLREHFGIRPRTHGT